MRVQPGRLRVNGDQGRVVNGRDNHVQAGGVIDQNVGRLVGRHALSLPVEVSDETSRPPSDETPSGQIRFGSAISGPATLYSVQRYRRNLVSRGVFGGSVVSPRGFVGRSSVAGQSAVRIGAGGFVGFVGRYIKDALPCWATAFWPRREVFPMCPVCLDQRL